MKVADLSNPLVDVFGLLLIGGLMVLQMRKRRVCVRRLWLIPALVIVLTCVTLLGHPPTDLVSWGWLGAALVVGLAVGLTRVALVDVHQVDPDTGQLQVQITQLGVLLWLAVFAARVVIRQVFGRSDPDASIVGLVTAIMLMFSVGNVVANAAATYRAYERAKRSLAW